MEFLAIMTTDLQKATRICDHSRLELISPGPPVTAVWIFPVIEDLTYDAQFLRAATTESVYRGVYFLTDTYFFRGVY